MSHNTYEETPSRPFTRLITLGVLIVALLASLIIGTVGGDKSRLTPDLALDLEGGTEIILTPQTTDGSKITEDDVNQAIEIIRQRVDASGVAEAEITAQGGSNIIVALPGNPSQETLDLVRTSAVLRMRPVISVAGPEAVTRETYQNFAGEDAEDVTSMSDEEFAKAVEKLADTDGDGKISDQPENTPADGSDAAWVTEQTLLDLYTLQCGTQQTTADDPTIAFVSCDPNGTVKYILGPAALEGSDISSAASGQAVNANGQSTGGWAVNMQFTSEGSDKFFEVTQRIATLPAPQNQFAIVLDGQTISAPSVHEGISGGQAQITGQFKAPEAESLANQLSFGSLPLYFNVQSEEQISATLGSEQLTYGLIAGAVGFLLIIFYMLWQYHALGIVAIASIALATGLSFFVVSLLSWTMGYRLSMAGVLGIIISIGVTADSFIVYFERIRDEIRDGLSITRAIEEGWIRARRTIIISDFVNLVASAVLYILTVGSVRGFAFTLGLTPVLDLVVVMMFTYPVMHYLGRTAFFGQGKNWSGLNAQKLEQKPIYRGRGGSSTKKKSTTARKAVVGPDGRDATLHDYEYPDAEFMDADVRPGETLAQRRARQRREARRAAEGGEE